MMGLRKEGIVRIGLLAATVVMAAGCTKEKGTGHTVPAGPTEGITEAPTVIPVAAEEEEVSYMEKYKELVEVKPEEEIYKVREGVEYPEFQKYTYYSTTAERETNVNVLLPPGYSEEKEYPVLYILHGFWDNEDWMARPVVSISTMLSNLYADGKAEEMIVVLPYIYCSKDMPYCTGMDLTNSLNYDNFINDLTTDLMPFIEGTFSVAKGRENTAITGFSMGGRESLFIGFSHPELFGYIGAVCPAPGLLPVANSPMHPGQMTGEELLFSENTPYVLMVSASKADGVVGTSPKTYHNVMTKNETEHIWHELLDTGHDHTSVKPHLYNFLRLLFK
ncbi:MAG: esterase family protein [Lachnospiraceae bacterium]|nr:esterase family protein [Lachnospiraceae bacterium]